ncbi:MAG: cyclic nucleotide-binding domain-containing protein [Archangium sp.]|nr:cyclic nucleotide-binding domain-containing protein [Archangium sp.]
MTGAFDAAYRRLQGTWLLHDLPEASLRHLAAGATERALQPGELLLEENTPGDALYVVLEGALQVTRRSPSGIQVLGEVRRGEHLGELALLDDAPRTASATATEPTRALVITRASFEACLAHAPGAAHTLGRLREYRRAWSTVRRVRPPAESIAGLLARFVTDVPAERLGDLAQHVEWVTVPSGALLFRQGESGDALYFVVTGTVEVLAERDDGQEIRLGEASPGEALGEMALLSGEARMASARAACDVELLKLSREGFDALVKAHPQAMTVFARTMATRLAKAARGRGAIAQLRSTRVLTLEECTAAVRLTDPVLLNLTITQLYHRLAVDLTLMLGAQDANWFAFGCRASKTAGNSIRGEELPLREVLRLTPLWPALLKGVEAARGLSLTALFEDTLRTVADRVAEGNRFIFEEIGPAFVRFVGEFVHDTDYDPKKFDAFLGTFRPGPSERGGQDTLKGALSAYYEATFERSPRRRAELILLGSLKTGLHEQVRVDPIIDRALDAPLEVFFDSAARLLPRPLRPAAHLARGPLQRRVRSLLTRRMMRYQLPDLALDLGDDVPAWKGAHAWPPMLRTLEHPELRTLFESLTAGAPSRARDWSVLGDRMRFIATLFRSRQKSLQLFEPPYLDTQEAEIRSRRIPRGAL